MQTIFAQATAGGKAGVAIVRVSGPDAREIGERLCGSTLPSGKPSLRRLLSQTGEIIDQALILYFKAPSSFTGEDVVEFQLHGSRAVVRAVLSAIQNSGLARIAEPGEFTQRALLNDKMDLSQVEGLADLIEAETEAQRKQAMLVFEGGLSEKTGVWRDLLLRCAGLLEASIDFADEDVPINVLPEVSNLLTSLKSDLELEVAGSRVAERLRDGFEVAIIGAPNSGKSTLLNALAGRDVAITSAIAGTTRDVIEARMDVRGLPVTFLDTAGMRETDDEVERIGLARAVSRAVQADLRVVLLTDDWIVPDELRGMVDLSYRSKVDVRGGQGLSGKTGVGIDTLLEDVRALLDERVQVIRLAVSERQRDGISMAVVAIEQSLQLVARFGDLELVAEHVRQALRALDSVIGRVDVEAVLGEVFSRFCIGK